MASAPLPHSATCPKCEQEKAATTDHFYFRSGRLIRKCRECSKAAFRAYYAECKDQMLSRIHRARAGNLEFHRERDKDYYRRHLAAKKQRAAEYRRKNPEKVATANKEWRAKNPKQYDPLRNAVQTHKRRARLCRGAGFSASDIETQRDAQEGRCYYCRDPAAKLTIEHFVPLSRGGANEPRNIVLACGPCNYRKGPKLPWEWMPDKFAEDCQP
jgi:5-methylcytosine-specific restriction endonuclease McrA